MPKTQIEQPNYKHTQYQTELASGQFQATEEDLADVNVITHVDPIDITEFEGPKIRSGDERQAESLKKVMSSGQIRKLHHTVRERAHNSYQSSILTEFPDLKANADKVINAQESAAKRHKPMKIDAGTYYLKKEIRQLQRKLQFLKDTNSEMEEHIKVLTKARDTLSFEESAAKLKDVKLDMSEYNMRAERARKEYNDTMKRLEANSE